MKSVFASIVEHKSLCHNIYKLVVEGDFENCLPGQFMHVKIDCFTLRRPISINEINGNQITMIYKVIGEGTDKLTTFKVGESLDILGPLGNGYNLDLIEGNKIVLFGGGVGIPPMYELSKQLKNLGKEVIHILGFQSKHDVFYEEEFAQLGKTIVTTVDGSYGIQGFVTSVLKEKEFDFYCACGPESMLLALEKTYPNTKGFISIENRMACGIGACYACICGKKNEDYTRVCIDGPVYPVGEVKLCD